MNSLEITKDIIVAMLNNKTLNVSDDYATNVANAYEIIFNKVEELRNK